MSFSDLYDSGEHSRNLGHFASIANMAAIDGEVKPEEEAQLRRFAAKLNINEEEYKKVIENPAAFPISPHNSEEKRLERLHDLFRIIFADHEMNEKEMLLVKRYAIGLGFSSETSEKIIEKSVRIFSGQISFDDYFYLLNK